jgi:hypothetical protein
MVTTTIYEARWHSHNELNPAQLEREARIHVSDLDLALALMSKKSDLYTRLDTKQHGTLLQILAKKIVINGEGKIVDHRLNSPFVYLRSLADSLKIYNNELGYDNTSPGIGVAPNSSTEVNGFLTRLRFERRSKLEEIFKENR